MNREPLAFRHQLLYYQPKNSFCVNNKNTMAFSTYVAVVLENTVLGIPCLTHIHTHKAAGRHTRVLWLAGRTGVVATWSARDYDGPVCVLIDNNLYHSLYFDRAAPLSDFEWSRFRRRRRKRRRSVETARRWRNSQPPPLAVPALEGHAQFKAADFNEASQSYYRSMEDWIFGYIGTIGTMAQILSVYLLKLLIRLITQCLRLTKLLTLLQDCK